jgi:E3 ubiquitin-protein ligase RAD18
MVDVMALPGMDDVTDATDFRSEEMQALERALRCGVCKDFFDSPILVPQCGHSFCSMVSPINAHMSSTPELCVVKDLGDDSWFICGSYDAQCIRDYLASTTECPSCRTTTSASSLLKNSMLEDAIFAYRAARCVVTHFSPSPCLLFLQYCCHPPLILTPSSAVT